MMNSALRIDHLCMVMYGWLPHRVSPMDSTLILVRLFMLRARRSYYMIFLIVLGQLLVLTREPCLKLLGKEPLTFCCLMVLSLLSLMSNMFLPVIETLFRSLKPRCMVRCSVFCTMQSMNLSLRF